VDEQMIILPIALFSVHFRKRGLFEMEQFRAPAVKTGYLLLMDSFPIVPVAAWPLAGKSDELPHSWHFYRWVKAEQLMSHTSTYKAYYQFLHVNGFLISYQLVQATAPCELAYHCQGAQPVLNYVLKGSLTIYAGGESLGTYADSQYFLWQLLPNTSVQMHYKQGEHRIFQIAFSDNLLSILLDMPGEQLFLNDNFVTNKRSPVLPIRQQLQHLLNDVMRYAKKLNTYVIPLNARLFQLVDRFAKTIIREQQTTAWKKKKAVTLAELPAYIQAHLDFDDRAAVSLPELARKLRTNPYQLQQLFKTQFGVSPARYIQRSRMEKAIQLLSENALPVGAIYLQVGYSDLSSFSRAFTTYYGYAPSQLARR
jgi:AraC-like DNA-binding protein